MATKAKTTTKKRATASAKKTTRSAAAAAPKTTVRAQAAKKGSFAAWVGSSQTVFKPKTALGTLLAEFVGTFVLASLFIVGKGNLLYILFGMVGVTYAGLRLSGSHFNPAISLAAWATRRMSAWRLLGYIVAQVLGAMLALLVAHGLLPAQPSDVTSALQGGASVYQLEALTKDKEWYLFFAQMLGTAIFAYAFASTWDGFRNHTSRVLAISFGFFAGLAITAQFAVLNPAVAVALGGVKWEVWPLAVYLAAPAIGAIVGAGLHKLFAADVAATDPDVL